MTVKLDLTKGKVPVTILSILGDLDASNYQEVINTAEKAVKEGGQCLLIDMSEVSFMSSSGIIALHSIALMMRGDKLTNPEYGWEAFRALDRDKGSGIQERVKILNPQPRVDRSLEISGMKAFFEIHTDLETAVSSFTKNTA